MNEVEKLRVLIPHWIEHNEEHASEFRDWAENTSQAAPELLEAALAEAISSNNEIYQKYSRKIPFTIDE